jgi:hypothetical protein
MSEQCMANGYCWVTCLSGAPVCELEAAISRASWSSVFLFPWSCRHRLATPGLGLGRASHNGVLTIKRFKKLPGLP